MSTVVTTSFRSLSRRLNRRVRCCLGLESMDAEEWADESFEMNCCNREDRGYLIIMVIEDTLFSINGLFSYQIHNREMV